MTKLNEAENKNGKKIVCSANPTDIRESKPSEVPSMKEVAQSSIKENEGRLVCHIFILLKQHEITMFDCL